MSRSTILFSPPSPSYPAGSSCARKDILALRDALRLNVAKCLFQYSYDNTATEGVVMSESFTFDARHKAHLDVTFGCANITAGSLVGASEIMCISLKIMSLVSQLELPRFSYCLPQHSVQEVMSLVSYCLP